MQGPVQPPRLLIFDFDGTLADSGPWVAGVLNDVARRYGFRQSTGPEMEALRGEHVRTILRRLGIPLWRVPAIARHMRTRMANEIDRIHLFEGVPAMLDRLCAQGAALAVASSNSEANVRRVLGGVAAQVGYFECGSSLFGKAARFRHVLARAGVQAGDALCIGDEVRDAEAARRAGIAFAAVGWGYTTVEALRAQGPVLLAATPGALADALAGRALDTTSGRPPPRPSADTGPA